MEIEYKGGNCVVITVKKDTVVVDGSLSGIGFKDVAIKGAIYIATQVDFKPKTTDGAVVIDGPGEYEISDISIKGIASQRMVDANDDKNATVYRLSAGGVTVAIIGHVHYPLDDEQLEEIGNVDIVVIPVGGGGYTLDGHQAAQIIRQLEPKIIIPTHYADKSAHYEVPQENLDLLLKEMNFTHEKMETLKIKNAILPETVSLVELQRR